MDQTYQTANYATAHTFGILQMWHIHLCVHITTNLRTIFICLRFSAIFHCIIVWMWPLLPFQASIAVVSSSYLVSMWVIRFSLSMFWVFEYPIITGRRKGFESGVVLSGVAISWYWEGAGFSGWRGILWHTHTRAGLKHRQTRQPPTASDRWGPRRGIRKTIIYIMVMLIMHKTKYRRVISTHI